MSKTSELADIHFKIDSEVKNTAEVILDNLGLNMSNYLNMALRQLIYAERVPFDVKVKRPFGMDETPEEIVNELRRRVEEVESGKSKFMTVEEAMAQHLENRKEWTTA